MESNDQVKPPEKWKLPAGWEKCRIDRKGVRKWRNVATASWVTDMEGEPVFHCGIDGDPVKYSRQDYTLQQVIDLVAGASRWLP